MAGNTFGKIFRITTWGESHGKALGVVVDGVPAGLPVSEADIQAFLDRRKPGGSRFSTPRKEADAVQILSGVFEGKATGTPISLLIPNTSQRSADYSEIASYYRPGHADYTFDQKYGFRDYRGGGRSSGRETAGRVAAGAIASLLLSQLGIRVCAYTKSIGPVFCERFCEEEIRNNPLCMPDAQAACRAEAYLEECIKRQDSSGGVVECFADGVPAGLGDPVFDKLDAALAGAVMSIGAVKAVEIGDGTAVSRARGSENNDPFRMRDGHVEKETNHAGGILGGISDGSRILLRAHIKPTPSVFSEQRTVNREGEDIAIRIKGRHDPVIVPRAVVVVEAMTALVLADALLSNMGARLDGVREFYRR
ncbi:MAG TPA: chorismate synthase [Candidatus Eisenbergiella stercorigallinarum]|uniref:Chorismate synthase n=1 Tax=Candidatus Eisenbergiella stercorigallinarum TaxID=2838557 RepID=A0A9D2TYY1_9FIRM|nr:chorismate synthase [Candidatus Eisenbergiella stercorigallinarum]